MKNKNVTKWLSNQRRKQLLTVNKKDLSKLTKWIYGKKEIYHKSKKFFKIAGVRIQSNFYNKKKRVADSDTYYGLKLKDDEIYPLFKSPYINPLSKESKHKKTCRKTEILTISYGIPLEK